MLLPNAFRYSLSRTLWTAWQFCHVWLPRWSWCRPYQGSCTGATENAVCAKYQAISLHTQFQCLSENGTDDIINVDRTTSELSSRNWTEWLRTGSSRKLLWICWRTFEYHKRLWISWPALLLSAFPECFPSVESLNGPQASWIVEFRVQKASLYKGFRSFRFNKVAVLEIWHFSEVQSHVSLTG